MEHPFLNNQLQGLQSSPQHGATLLDQFKFFNVAGFDALMLPPQEISAIAFALTNR